MRTVTLKSVYEMLVFDLGLAPEMVDPYTRRALAGLMSARLATAWNWGEWPEWCAVERRAGLPVWSSDAAWAAGATVWNPGDGRYWQTLAGQPKGVAIPGGDWTEVSPPVPVPMGRVLAVYESEPLTNPRAKRVDYTMGEGGVVPARDLAEYFVAFLRPVPPITLTEYDPGVAYGAGAPAYHDASGDCWVALVAVTGVEPGADATKWGRVLFPEALAPYVRHGAKADRWRAVGQYEQAGAAERQAMEELMRAYDLAVPPGGGRHLG